jgi:hypothetical protein
MLFYLYQFFLLQIVKAKIILKTNTDKSFTLDHFWGILNQAPKWMKHFKASQAALARSKANAKEQDVPNSNVSSLAKVASNVLSSDVAKSVPGPKSQNLPEGSKGAKKHKNEDVSIANLLKGQNELLELSQKKQKLFEDFSDHMLMAKDLDGMDEETLAYFKAKRKKAIACMNEES